MKNSFTFLIAKEKSWESIFNTNSELSQNRIEKQIMLFKTTVNWLSNDIWCYLVIGCFDWKIDVFQQTVVRVYCILKSTAKVAWYGDPLLILLQIESLIKWKPVTVFFFSSFTEEIFDDLTKLSTFNSKDKPLIFCQDNYLPKRDKTSF